MIFIDSGHIGFTKEQVSTITLDEYTPVMRNELMNSLILKDKSGIITDPHQLKHIHETLKLKVGDIIKCTVLNQGLTKGRVEAVEKTSCHLKLESLSPGETQWFDLVIGLSRPQTSKKILEHATTFGARKIQFFKAALSEKSYLDSKIFEDRAYEEFLIAGLSQSAIYTDLPQFKLDIYNPANQYQNAPQKFILDLKAEKSFSDLHLDFAKPITLAIGPERGFIDEDIEKFHAAGFTSIKISSSVLRVEHAVYSAISQLELLRARF
ncbi:MAG: RsmE family RNA methyltransferase [Bacteriovorax sp.]|jgi:RsmE family RNA methyltransferase